MEKNPIKPPVMQVYALRGATTVDADTKEEIVRAAGELMDELCSRNGLFSDGIEIVSITASNTSDIKAFYPAAAIRQCGFEDVPLFSALEPDIAGGLPLCIRVLVTVSSTVQNRADVEHVYLKGAKILRPDLLKK